MKVSGYQLVEELCRSAKTKVKSRVAIWLLAMAWLWERRRRRIKRLV